MKERTKTFQKVWTTWTEKEKEKWGKEKDNRGRKEYRKATAKKASLKVEVRTKAEKARTRRCVTTAARKGTRGTCATRT